MENKPLLLVAEDDPDDQYLIQFAIEESCAAGIETNYVWDGMELLSTLNEKVKQNFPPNLIVLDLNMPRKDGRQVLQEIKMDPELARIPVAILTTSNTEEDVLFCQSYGVVGYYCKPSSMSELRKIVGKLCRDFLSCEK